MLPEIGVRSRGSTFEEESEMIGNGPVRGEMPFRPQREMRRGQWIDDVSGALCRSLFIGEIVFLFDHVHFQGLKWNNSI